MQFERFEQLVGTENFNKVKNLKILVIGVGGVGGYVVESLVRCGVESITIVDPDVVDESNINRQIIATTSAIGKKKVDVWKDRIHNISPICHCNIVDSKFGQDIESIDELQRQFSIQFDFVVDACDDVLAKKKIIKECSEKQFSLVSSMGTGKRMDPSKLEITTLDKTNYDPIAKILRKFVRDEHIHGKIIVLVSREQPLKIAGQKVASCSFVPASAGFLIASYIVRKVIVRE